MSQPEQKKKGRPKKVQDVTADQEVPVQKKRGRKKKEKDETAEVVPKEKKKRGRKATLKFFSSSIRKKMPLVSDIGDSDKYICHLDIIDNNDDEVPEQKGSILFDTPQERNIKDELKGNDYVFLSQYFSPNPKDSWTSKTDVCCWWCCNRFEEVPLGMPVSYDKSVHKFRTRGIFCSFACMSSYDMESCSNKHKSLISVLYSKLTGNLKIINPAPPRYTLQMFGGTLTLEQFRAASKEDRIYRMIMYPMYISRDYIEEIDIKNLKTVNNKLFGTQEHVPKTLLDSTKINELKTKVKNNSVITVNSIDKFITLT